VCSFALVAGWASPAGASAARFYVAVGDSVGAGFGASSGHSAFDLYCAYLESAAGGSVLDQCINKWQKALVARLTPAEPRGFASPPHDGGALMKPIWSVNYFFGNPSAVLAQAAANPSAYACPLHLSPLDHDGSPAWRDSRIALAGVAAGSDEGMGTISARGSSRFMEAGRVADTEGPDLASPMCL
jgi:hypothetical protein